jgi:hypothetical protein
MDVSSSDFVFLIVLNDDDDDDDDDDDIIALPFPGAGSGLKFRPVR